MTISNNYAPDVSTGNGVTTVFTGSWTPLVASYMRVYLEVIATGVQTLQVLNTDYSLSFTDSGYTVTFLITPPPSTKHVIRAREVAADQTTEYTTAQGFQGEIHEGSFDKVTALLQDLSDAVDRSVKFQLGSSSTATVPEPAADEIIGWDAAGTNLENKSLASIGALVVSAYAETLLDDTTAAAARTTLGASTIGGTIFTAADAAAVKTALSLATVATTGAYSDLTGTPTTSPSTVGFLKLRGSSAGAAQTATFTADQIILGTTLGGTNYKKTSMSLSFNGAGTGANGMDTGSMPNGAALYIYAIYNPGTDTVAALGTTSGAGATIYAGANMPSGYTASVLIWSGITVTTNFNAFRQYDRMVDTNQVTILSASAGVATSTSQSIAAAVPPNATHASGLVQQAQAAGTAQQVDVSSDGTLTIGSFSGFFYPAGNTVTGSYSNINFKDVPLITAQTIYWTTANTTAASVDMRVRGYRF